MPKPRASASASEHDDSAGVSALIEKMAHPLRATLEAVRQAILKAAPGITEGIKWNSPSFYCCGWFATVNVRKDTLMVVLHHGAKSRAESTLSETLEDKTRLLTWPGKDRALVTFVSDGDFQKKRKAFQSIVKQWAAWQQANGPAD